MNLNNIYNLNIKNTDYYCIISGISKREALKLLQNIDCTEESRALYKNTNIKSFFEAINLLEILI